MSVIYPFAALRPLPPFAGAVASVPYDVVSTDEARALAAGNPLSFLHVSRPEIDLPAGTDPHADEVYQRAASAFVTLRNDAPLVVRRYAPDYEAEFARREGFTGDGGRAAAGRAGAVVGVRGERQEERGADDQ